MTPFLLQRLAIFILFCLSLTGCIYGEKESQQSSATNTTSSATDRVDMGPLKDMGAPKYPDVPCEGDESCEEGQTCLEGLCVCAPKQDYSNDALHAESIPTSFQDGFEVLPFLSEGRLKAPDTYSTQSPHFLLMWLKDGSKDVSGLLLDGRARPLNAGGSDIKGKFTISEALLRNDIKESRTNLSPDFTYSILSFSTVQRGFTPEVFLMVAVKEAQKPSKADLLILSYPVTVNADLTTDVQLKSSWLTEPFEVNLTDTIHWGATSFDLRVRAKAEGVYVVESNKDGAQVTSVFRQGANELTVGVNRQTAIQDFKSFVAESEPASAFPKAVRGRLEARQGQENMKPNFALAFSFLAEGSMDDTAQIAFHFAYLEDASFEGFKDVKKLKSVVSGIDLEIGAFNVLPDVPNFALSLGNRSKIGQDFLVQGLFPYVFVDKSKTNLDFFQTFPFPPTEQMNFVTANQTSLALKYLHDSALSYDFTQGGEPSRYFFSASGLLIDTLAKNLVQILSLNKTPEASAPVTLRTSELVFYKEMSLQWATKGQVLFLKSSIPNAVVEAIPLTAQGTPFCTTSPP